MTYDSFINYSIILFDSLIGTITIKVYRMKSDHKKYQ